MNGLVMAIVNDVYDGLGDCYYCLCLGLWKIGNLVLIDVFD